jgi:peroxiredoxin
MCSALAVSPNPRSLAVLEKIQSTHPDPKTQGVAALGAAIQLKTLGDDGEIMRKRLNYLRKAIIQSSDIDIQGTTVAKIAEDELHVIRYLTKGRVAPNLVGMDSANRPLSLEANKGKIIVLLFWNSNMQDAQRVIDITNKLVTKFRGRPLVVLGVNNDPEAALRALQANDTVTWQNFSDPQNKLAKEFRIGSWPAVFVLDGERKIHYAGTPGSFAELTAEALLSELKPVAPE